MSDVPSTSTSHSNFVPIFNAALESYKRKTKKDLTSHPLLSSLQSCDSPEAVLSTLRDKIPAFNRSPDRDDGLTKWVTPTVNVLYTFSDTVGRGVGLAFLPVNAIFAGIGVLLSAAKDTSASRDTLIDILNRIERFFHRLEIYTGITPTTAMTDIIVEIMVEVLTILAIATKEVKSGRFKKYFKKLTGNRDIEDSLERLDKLTQEEARMASAEQLKMIHSVDGKVIGVDGRVRGVEDQVQGVRSDVEDVRVDVQDVSNKVQDVDDKVHDVGNKVQDVDDTVQGIDSNIQGVDDKLDQGTSSEIVSYDGFRPQIRPQTIILHTKPITMAQLNDSSKEAYSISGNLLAPSCGYTENPVQEKVLFAPRLYKISWTCAILGWPQWPTSISISGTLINKLCNVLPSLLVQLSARSDACCDKLSQLYSAHDRGVQKPSDHTMAECLKQMLALKGQGPTYIILDALDECPVTSSIPSPREEVLELVKDLVGLHLPNLHICVTSRPEPDIQIVLERFIERPVSLHDEGGQKDDIVNYISSSVHSDRRMGRWREEDKELVIKTLSEKADGMFRWVFCQLELLRQCFPPSVRRILEELPDSLDETYERMLREIRKPNRGHAHRLLQCLVVAIRPLEVKELAEVLAFDFNTGGMPKLDPGWRWEDQEEAVMSACSSLVTIVKNGDSRVVQFSHFSVKEFLTANRLVEPMRDVSRYHIQLEAAHTILAQACLGILLRLDDRVDYTSIESFPLALYAAQYWPTHARVENVSLHIKDGMERLFDADKPHFATWLWICNEDQWGRFRFMSTMRPEEPEAVPLYHATRLGLRDLAERLIVEHPEHVNARGGIHETPIHAAVHAEHANILSLLIEHGADIEGQNRSINGATPLDRAAWHGRLEVGRCLIDHGANINARDSDRNTPLIEAVAAGHVEFARMLLKRGAVIDAQNVLGHTALHYAVGRGYSRVVQLLLEHGADVNVRDEEGNTPSKLASLHGSKKIVELMSAYDAESVKK